MRTRVVAAAVALSTAMGPQAGAAPAVEIPPGVTTGFAVYDRNTGQMTAQHQATMRFRSASIVKILIALDYLNGRGVGTPVPDIDLALLEPMLRSSDDTAASILWDRNGYNSIVQRMVALIGLTETQPPADPNWWGRTAVSASDVVKIYRYLLERAPQQFRDFVLGNLRKATQCATDERDQYFGIPRALPRPWAVKQGWSGYPDPLRGEKCVVTGEGVGADEIDLRSPALHTSGLVGEGDRKIVVVLTLHPEGTPWATAAGRITTLTKSVFAASVRS
ncbi:class A beta-lactamase-related serine hydrolase [Allokutzneria sp. A3M-2-11 16]|uniref:class A beta-lactamase-related serine hydrolase n=1 Tax=Allokutzneria sp. A3M-2-11 16 TaxID=2962043 RepID=UPI0020B6421E|nr:class A beta-lactamase-related serine hydrolase [Allokutzneria sp. A3M-2-11 16]MCP3799104.1 class A beta-lactamase-related serine hydrolase [Allokutzneria sp. A3M-2-11 16]